ncbi:APC family permease [Egicoccus sp. AB-alg2]|uniref:APC family permease n=1 Tax=Egicoccus sp. AB-alg2 TaxID=3242693 RepID=UPI00359D7777
MTSLVKRLLVGRPLATAEEYRTRLPKRIGLAVFASDAISSTAYATEEILFILVPVAGLAALHLLVPISLVVALVLLVVVLSYRQTIYAYPDGGGAYVVARQNLGERWSLLAGASLLVDYTLTVAVSVSAGVAAVVSALPELLEYRVEIGVGVVALIAVANLRGAKESGTLFAIPTYLYLVALGALLLVGLWRTQTGALTAAPVDPEQLAALTGGSTLGLTGLAGALIVARAFSSGAVALTGTEAITNGIPAFRRPESRNAARTLGAMGLILGSAFLGISVLADRLRPLPSEDETVLSQLGGAVFGRGSFGYGALQITTMAILFLAANTAFADFPRLSSLISRDGFLPRQLSHRGDRLVFSNGILLLGGAAAVLLIAFGGSTTALIPLYAVGVFTGFTVSQVGMVRHHARLREPGWRRAQAINAVGATATATVLVVVVVSKFTTGAWIPVVVIPVIIGLFRTVHRHYLDVKRGLAVPVGYRARPRRNIVVVPVSRVHRGAVDAIAYARNLHADEVRVVTVVLSDEEAAKLRRQWKHAGLDLTLDVIQDPYRQLVNPLLRYLDRVQGADRDAIVTVVLPEFVVEHAWQRLLHTQTAWWLRTRLRQRPNTVIASVPVPLPEEVHGRLPWRRRRTPAPAAAEDVALTVSSVPPAGRE